MNVKILQSLREFLSWWEKGFHYPRKAHWFGSELSLILLHLQTIAAYSQEEDDFMVDRDLGGYLHFLTIEHL